MNLEFRTGFNVDWLPVMFELYNKTILKRDSVEKMRVGFEHSYRVESAWLGSRLVAMGRAVSDQAMYIMIFDLVVDPEFQKRQLGREIMARLLKDKGDKKVFLTSTPGNERFYWRMGFRPHRAAFALYPTQSPYLDYDWIPTEKNLITEPIPVQNLART